MNWLTRIFTGTQKPKKPSQVDVIESIVRQSRVDAAVAKQLNREEEAGQLAEMAALEAIRLQERIERMQGDPKVEIAPLHELGDVTAAHKMDVPREVGYNDPEGQAEADRLLAEFVREANEKKARKEGRPPGQRRR